MKPLLLSLLVIGCAGVILIILDIIIRLKKSYTFHGPFSRPSDQDNQIDALRKITSKISEAEGFEPIINAIIQITIGSLKAELGSILLYNHDRKGLEIIASEGVDAKIRDNTIIDSDDSISWCVFKKNKPLLIKDFSNDERFKLQGNPAYKGNSAMAVPIRTSTETLGVFCVTNHLTRKPFTESDLETMNSISGQIAIIVDNELKNQEARKRMKELESLFQVSEQISRSLDLHETLNKIAHLAIEITGTDACSLRLLNPKTNELDIMVNIGVSPKYKQKGSLKIGEGVGGYVAREGVVAMIPNLKKDKRINYTSYLESEGLLSLVSVPIKGENERVIGIISVYRRQECEFPPEMVNLLSTYANNTSVAITNARLFESLKENYYSTIQSLALTLEARDKYTRGHSERVTEYALQIAAEMELSEDIIDNLRFAGRLHDIGKIGISDNILLKEGKLTLSEYADIKTHPIKGAELLVPLQFLGKVIPLIKYHHERFDGKGYPDGLKGEIIPFEARILSVADSFDAMTSERPYRAPLSQDQAMYEIAKHSGTQFDPVIVESFKRVIQKEGRVLPGSK